MNKTIWQKIYSFFGFWTYTEHLLNGEENKVLYWCCLPWFRYYRKYDLFRWKINKE